MTVPSEQLTGTILFMLESNEGIAEGATTAMGAENSEKATV